MVNVQGSVIRLCQRALLALPEELDTLLHRVDGISGLAGLAQQGPRRGGGGSSSIGGGSLERRRLARLDATRQRGVCAGDVRSAGSAARALDVASSAARSKARSIVFSWHFLETSAMQVSSIFVRSET